MDSLVGYGSDEDVESDHCSNSNSTVGATSAGGSRRREDDTNYDDVNMDMSEETRILSQESQGESEPELPPADQPPRRSRDDRNANADSRERRARDRSDKDRSRRDDRPKSDRGERGRSDGSRRGLLGDRPDKNSDKMPALMDLKPFVGEVPAAGDKKSQDARDAVSPRFTDRERRDKDKERDRDRGRRSDDRHRHSDRRERSRSRGATYPPPPGFSGSNDKRAKSRGSPPSGAEYRPSYKVNRKLEVMEKMGLQIKTPDGSMATAQQLRAAAAEQPRAAAPARSVLDQVQKRKLLWSNTNKSEAEEAAKWSGARFAQDNDGKQVSKFMRLMGIKDQAAVKPAPEVDPNKKQEELFEAMQAQYEVARATTHTMRGVGLGFQRGPF